MAIKDHQELVTAQQKLVQLQLAIEQMKATESARDFQIQAEGAMALITTLRREIDEYLGVAEAGEYDEARRVYLAFMDAPGHIRRAIEELLGLTVAV
ncbi:MAG: hypothetical protein HY314_13660 [Acidobacteria bacterium]|nr:hypothetical protein [Acidobacteriota bacterium]